MMAYIRELMHMSKGVRRFIASESLLGIGIGVYILVFNLHLLEIGLNEDDIGKITSLGTLVIGILSIPSGLMASRLGRKKLLVTGLLLMGLGYGGIGLGTTLAVFYIFQVIISIGITLLITSEIQLLFYYSRSKKEETQAFSMLFAVFTLFTGVGTLLGGYLPGLIGGKSTIYQSSILIVAVLVSGSGLIRLFLLPKEDQTEQKDNKFDFSKFKKQVTNKSIWLFSFFIFLFGASFAVVIPFLNIIVKFRLGWSVDYISLILTLNGLLSFFGSIIMPRILERWSIGKTYLIVYLTNILLSFILFFTIPVPVFALLLLIRGGSFTLLNNLIESQTMQAVEEDNRNLYAGMKSVTRSLGASLANLAAGIIMANKNYALPFLISGVLLIISYFIFFTWIRPIFDKELGSSKVTV